MKFSARWLRARAEVCLCLALIPMLLVPLLRMPMVTTWTMRGLYYIALSQSWNLMGGYLRRVSFGHAAFFGVGAYTVALVDLYRWQIPFGADVMLGGAVAAILAFGVGYPFLKLKGISFCMGTLGLAEILRTLSINEIPPFAGGRLGVSLARTPDPSVFYYVIVAISFSIVYVLYRLANSRYGLAFAAIRDKPDAAQMLGINVTFYEWKVFVLSAFLAGLVGAYFASFRGYVHGDLVFSINISFDPLLMVFFGGGGTITGPIIGALAVMTIREVSRTFILHGSEIVLALILALTMLFMPGGIVGAATGRVPSSEHS